MPRQYDATPRRQSNAAAEAASTAAAAAAAATAAAAVVTAAASAAATLATATATAASKLEAVATMVTARHEETVRQMGLLAVQIAQLSADVRSLLDSRTATQGAIKVIMIVVGLITAAISGVIMWFRR